MTNKNILFLTHTYNTFQKDQIESVAHHFDRVYVFVRYKPIAEISNFLPIRSLKAHRKKICVDLKGKPGNVEVVLVPIFYLPTRRGYLKLGDRLLRKTIRLIDQKKIRFDIIHAHYFWTSGYIAAELKKHFNTPVVITNHSTQQLREYPERSQTWKKKMLECIESADQIFVVNEFMAKRIKHLKKNASVKVLPVGFDPEKFYPVEKITCRKSLSLGVNDIIFLNISRLDENKNLELFIRGIHALLTEHPEVRGYILGEGARYKKLQKLIKQLNCESRIFLVGHVPHEQINTWINAADFVALTSFIEGSPTVMYEALACGKPFLGSRVGGIPEIIQNERIGLLFDPGNLKDFTNKASIMIDKKWNQNAIISFSNQFSHSDTSNEIIKSYNSLISR